MQPDTITQPDSTIDNDAAARKRQQIGLSPRRETASTSIMRPPTEAKTVMPSLPSRRPGPSTGEQPSSTGGWWLVFLLCALGVITFLLIAARFLQSPTDIATVQTELAQTTGRQFDLTTWQPTLAIRDRLDRWGLAQLFSRPGQRSSIWVDDEFEQSRGALARIEQPQQWVLGPVPAEGLYRMRVWPGYATWSRLGLKTLGNYRWETSVQISAATPASIAGLVLRFSDEFNFYLFAIDGEQRYQLQALVDGKWQMIKPWTDSALLLPGGQSNQLTVEDSGDQVRFAINGKTLYIELAPPLAVGDVGLWGAADSQTPAQIDYEWVRLIALQ